MNTEDIIYAITGSILLTLALIAAIIWLFKYSKIAKEETETKIKYFKVKTKYYENQLNLDVKYHTLIDDTEGE